MFIISEADAEILDFNNQIVLYLPDAKTYYLPVYRYGTNWD